MATDFNVSGSTQGVNYFGNHIAAPQNIQGTPMYNIEVGEGNNPPGDYFPAGYLNVQISENRISNTVGSWFVLMPGKVVTLDTTKRLVPAGYILDKAVADGSRKNVYTANDEGAGVVTADGTRAVAGDKVVTKAIAAGIDFPADPVGLIRYSALMAPGTDPSDPSTFYRHAYDTGGARAFTRWAYVQVPVVEINPRAEAIPQAVTSYRVGLYGGTYVFKKGVTTKSLTALASANLFSLPASGAEPTQYSVVGRTIFFNAPLDTATWTVTYTPTINLPFTCLKSDNGADISINNALGTNSAKGLKDFIMKQVGFDTESNFGLTGASGVSTHKIGRILDLKEGSSKDLALVRTYFRDFGLWQEAPGSATDGRNAILSIANAPKYIARIAVNFNVPSF
jgi:hypothetical protein